MATVARRGSYKPRKKCPYLVLHVGEGGYLVLIMVNLGRKPGSYQSQSVII